MPANEKQAVFVNKFLYYNFTYLFYSFTYLFINLCKEFVILTVLKKRKTNTNLKKNKFVSVWFDLNKFLFIVQLLYNYTFLDFIGRSLNLSSSFNQDIKSMKLNVYQQIIYPNIFKRRIIKIHGEEFFPTLGYLEKNKHFLVFILKPDTKNHKIFFEY